MTLQDQKSEFFTIFPHSFFFNPRAPRGIFYYPRGPRGPIKNTFKNKVKFIFIPFLGRHSRRLPMGSAPKPRGPKQQFLLGRASLFGGQGPPQINKSYSGNWGSPWREGPGGGPMGPKASSGAFVGQSSSWDPKGNIHMISRGASLGGPVVDWNLYYCWGVLRTPQTPLD